MSLPSLILSQSWSTTGRKGEEARGRRRVRFERRLCSCRTGDRRSEEREPAGKGGAPMVLQSAGDGGGAARRRHGEESRCDRRRWISMWRRQRHLRRGDWPDRSTPDGAAAQRPPCFLLLQRARAQGSGGGGAGGEGRRWARCAGGGDEDGGGSLRRSNRPWGGRSPTAT